MRDISPSFWWFFESKKVEFRRVLDVLRLLLHDLEPWGPRSYIEEIAFNSLEYARYRKLKKWISKGGLFYGYLMGALVTEHPHYTPQVGRSIYIRLQFGARILKVRFQTLNLGGGSFLTWFDWVNSERTPRLYPRRVGGGQSYELRPYLLEYERYGSKKGDFGQGVEIEANLLGKIWKRTQIIPQELGLTN